MPSLCESCGLLNQLEEINKKIAEIEAEQFRKEIVKKFKLFSQNPENINLPNMWKLLKKISPKIKSSLPSAKRNNKGKNCVMA